MSLKTRSLDVSFEAELRKSPAKGGWTYLVWPRSAAFFETKGLVKVRGEMDGEAFESAFMAMGGGVHKLPVRGTLAKRLGKQVGDLVKVRLTERIG